ncbi:MAG TPA: response regulator [bacterium]|nr:response regulator [bacterium]
MAYLLVVDDDVDFASAEATVLSDAGHEVKIEHDIKSAEKSMSERCPDLVILDVMFPESSSAGFNFARMMKHFNDEFKNIPILMLTAVNTMFPLGFSARDIDDDWLPVEDFLDKPVDFNLLRKKVSEMLSKTV